MSNILQEAPKGAGGFFYKPGNTLPLGVNKVPDGVQFAIYLADRKQCFLNIYRKGHKKPACRIELSGEFRRGSVYFVTITGQKGTAGQQDIAQLLSREYEYMYEADGEEFVDPYAAVIHGREKWGRADRTSSGRSNIRGGICLEEFDWEEDSQLRIPYTDMVLYQLHVRGYTKHNSSGVLHKGTFDGLMEKLPYLQELGINGVLLLPCYEFNEIQSAQAFGRPETLPSEQSVIREKVKLNYWGYGGSETYYFAPKASYASEPENPVREMKNLVKQFHRQGIEVLMDIYFSPGTNLFMMMECLRYWVMEYHIDGFRVNQEVMPSLLLASDPILSGMKLLTSYWDKEMLSQSGTLRQENALAEYNDGFMNDARRFLKSDEGMVQSFVARFQRNPKDFSVVNYITHVNGFTLVDLVSYDIKHNEENGEMNQDGTEYNYSWNCGVEGKSRKKTIVSRRMRQIRNAFLMLLLSQGTPMLRAGDEFGNSQNGNNNAYCQDNAVSWLNWRQVDTCGDILEYVKKLICFRKEHPVLHQKQELLQYDWLSCGMPDLSVHGVQAWKADYSAYNRMLGLLLYGDYETLENGKKDDSIYIIFNMYWENKSFDLPNLPGDKEWYVAIETYDNSFTPVPDKKPGKTRKKKPLLESQRKTIVPPRSIVVFVGR